MCDPKLIAAILEELGYLDDKKGKEKKEELRDKETDKDNSKNSGAEEKQLSIVDMTRSFLKIKDVFTPVFRWKLLASRT